MGELGEQCVLYVAVIDQAVPTCLYSGRQLLATSASHVLYGHLIRQTEA